MRIIGLKKIKKKIMKNSKGDILKYVNKKDYFFKKFGEIYFNEIKLNKRKGWNLHKKNTCIISIIYGKVEFKFIDGRNKSSSFGMKDKIVLSKKSHRMITIPPGIWFSFKSLNKISIIANLIDDVHNKNETMKSEVV